MMLPSGDFKSPASADFATPACLSIILFYTLDVKINFTDYFKLNPALL